MTQPSTRALLENTLLAHTRTDEPPRRTPGHATPRPPATGSPRDAVLIVPAQRGHLPARLWRACVVTFVVVNVLAAVTLILVLATRAVTTIV